MGFKSVLAKINNLLPQNLQTENCSPEEIAQTLNHCARAGLLDRRTFLQIAGLITSTQGLAQLLFPQSAQAMYNLGAFWRKPNTTASSGYPSNSGSDPYWDYVSLLMNMDMPTPSTGFTTVFADEANVGRPITILGTPYIDTSAGSSPYSGKTGSVYFNGSTDRLSFADHPDFEVTGDYTVEVWVKPSSVSTNQAILGKDANSGSTWASYNFSLTSSATWRFSVSTNNSSQDLNSTFGSVSAGTWYHIAIVRSSGNWKVYVNGTSLYGPTSTGNPYDGSGPFTLGQEINTGTSNWFTGRMADLRVYKGVAKYTANFTPSTTSMGLGTAKDKYWAYCVAACPFENTLKDMSGRYATVLGNAVLSTTQSKFGTSSMYCDQSGANGLTLTTGTATNFGMGDFTLEGWVYYTSSGTNDHFTLMCHSDYNGSASGNWTFRITTGGVELATYDAQSNAEYVSGSISPTVNTWNHIAAVRIGTRVTIYVNGVSSGFGTLTKALGDDTSGLKIGYVTTGGAYRISYLDSIRITKGFARYRGNFTPPTTAFPAGKDETVDPFWNYTVLAMHMDDFTDATGRQTISNNGSVSTSSTKTYGTGSATFNGSNSLTAAAGADFNFGTDPFTVETWIYPTTTNKQSFIGQYQDGGGSSSFFVMILPGGTLQVYLMSASETSMSSTGKVVANQWNHIALTRTGGKAMLFINGILDTSATFSSSLSSALPFRLGNTATSQGALTGNMDEVRVTKGIARYTQNFTPPTRAFATSQYTNGSGSIVTSGLVANLDAGDSTSYSGSGQTWNNLVSSPADGEAQSTYNFYLGTSSSAESSDPTFTGSAGKKTANDYFLFDGGDVMTMASNNTPYVLSIHKANAQYTIIMVMENYSGSNNALIGDNDTNVWSYGFSLHRSSGTDYFRITNASGTPAFSISTTNLIPSTKAFFALSINASATASGPGANTGFAYLNGGYHLWNGSNTFAVNYSSPTTNAATYPLTIGSAGTSSYVQPSGFKLYQVMFYNRALTKAELDQNWNATRSRFGL